PLFPYSTLFRSNALKEGADDFTASTSGFSRKFFRNVSPPCGGRRILVRVLAPRAASGLPARPDPDRRPVCVRPGGGLLRRGPAAATTRHGDGSDGSGGRGGFLAVRRPRDRRGVARRGGVAPVSAWRAAAGGGRGPCRGVGARRAARARLEGRGGPLRRVPARAG